MLGGPANASPLQAVTASAYGLSVTGALTVAPTPTTSASFPPSADNQFSSLLNIPAEPLIISGTATVRAVTATDSTIAATVPADRLVRQGGGPLPALYNARAYSRIEGLGVLLGAEPIEGVDILPDAGIRAGAIEAEALVSCVNGAPVVVTGSRLIGPLNVLGLDLEAPVDNTVNTVTDALNIPGVLEARRNVVNPVPGGVEVIALQLAVLGTTLVVNLAEARVSGSTCGPVPECSDGIDNDGDGRIDIADPDCHTDGNADNPASYDPNDPSEAGLLPRTGGTGPLLGVSLLGAGLLALLAAQKLRRSELG